MYHQLWHRLSSFQWHRGHHGGTVPRLGEVSGVSQTVGVGDGAVRDTTDTCLMEESDFGSVCPAYELTRVLYEGTCTIIHFDLYFSCIFGPQSVGCTCHGRIGKSSTRPNFGKSVNPLGNCEWKLNFTLRMLEAICVLLGLAGYIWHSVSVLWV